MWETFKQFIHDISDWLEALGFIVGTITVIKVFFINRDVRKIQEKHLFQVRVDDHLKDLKSSSKIISNLITDFKGNIKEIKLEVSNCIEHCRSLRKKIPKDELKNLEPLIKNMTKIKNNKIDINTLPTFFDQIFGRKPIIEDEIDAVYTQITSLITELEHHNKDLKKSIK